MWDCCVPNKPFYILPCLTWNAETVTRRAHRRHYKFFTLLLWDAMPLHDHTPEMASNLSSWFWHKSFDGLASYNLVWLVCFYQRWQNFNKLKVSPQLVMRGSLLLVSKFATRNWWAWTRGWRRRHRSLKLDMRAWSMEEGAARRLVV